MADINLKAPDPEETKLETKLQALGLNAPRVTPAMIDAMIERTEYIMLPGNHHMVCKLYLFGGRYHVTGESATVSPENFKEDIAEEISYRNARNKIWPLAGAILANDLHNNRPPLPEEIQKQPEAIQRVFVELNQNMARLKGLSMALADEASLAAAGVDPVELELLKEQHGHMAKYCEVLQKRLARIGL